MKFLENLKTWYLLGKYKIQVSPGEIIYVDNKVSPVIPILPYTTTRLNTGVTDSGSGTLLTVTRPFIITDVIISGKCLVQAGHVYVGVNKAGTDIPYYLYHVQVDEILQINHSTNLLVIPGEAVTYGAINGMGTGSHFEITVLGYYADGLA